MASSDFQQRAIESLNATLRRAPDELQVAEDTLEFHREDGYPNVNANVTLAEDRDPPTIEEYEAGKDPRVWVTMRNSDDGLQLYVQVYHTVLEPVGDGNQEYTESFSETFQQQYHVRDTDEAVDVLESNIRKYAP